MARSERLRKEENAFREVEHTTDKPLAYFYYLIRLSPTVTDVRRYATNEVETDVGERLFTNTSVGGQKTSLQPSDKPPTKRARRTISGTINFDGPHSHPRSFGLIGEDGIKGFHGTLQFELHEGPEEQSSAHHWDASTGDGETIIFVLFVTPERFDWLWQEMSIRPTGKLTLNFSVRLYQHEVERHLSEPFHPQQYLVESQSHNPITDISFTISDDYPSPNPQAIVEPSDDTDPALAEAFDPPEPATAKRIRPRRPSTNTLLKLIIALQVLMLVAIISN